MIEDEKTNKSSWEGKDYLIFIKGSGKFYNLYNDDALIINYLLNYKIIKNNTCGFPECALNKVINEIEKVKISYVVKEMGNIIERKNYKKLNKYYEILEKAKRNLEINERLDNLIEKIYKLPPNKFLYVMEKLEEVVYEQQ